MEKLLLIFSIFFISLTAFSNELDGRIYGSVIDGELLEPIPYATVIITDIKGTLVTGSVTAEDGTFSIDKIPHGTYTIGIQFMGYKTFSIEIELSETQPSYNLEVIELDPEMAMLEGVTIVAERSTIEQRIDRKVINIGKDLTTVGASASELMNNIPSVSVDQDGNISLRGNDNVRILIDGKTTNMDAAELLKQIPSTSIKSIELITNPSAKYNPEGMSGIINILLHKNANDGFNGHLNTGVIIGEYVRTNGSIDLNYRKNKFNFYGNFGTQLGKNKQLGRMNFTENNYKQEFDIIGQNETYLYKLGVDFILNDKNTFSFYTNQSHGFYTPKGALQILYPNPQQNLIQGFDFDLKTFNSTYNFAYDRKFEKEGHEIIFEGDYNNLDLDSKSIYIFEGNTVGLEDFWDNDNEKRKNITANIDYVNPLTENSKLEIGAEVRLLDTNSDFITNGTITDDATYQYMRDIYSLYTTYGQSFEKWSYQIGTRLEQYKVDAVYKEEKVFNDEYFNIYPSGYLQYSPSHINSYQLSYSRRIDRPGFRQVNPISDVSSPRLSISGNPMLKPQLTNSIEFNYTRNFKKNGSVIGGIFVRNINDEIGQTFIEDPNEEGSLLMTFDNFEDNNAYGLELSLNYKLTSWWSSNSSFEIYNQKLKGIVGSENLMTSNTAWTFRTNHSFKITDKLTAQLFGFYKGASKSLQFDMKPMYFMNLGVRYSLLNNQATLSLNLNDIFNTQEFKYINGRPLAQEGKFKGDSRTAYLGFSYRFGDGKNQKSQRKTRKSDELEEGGMF